MKAGESINLDSIIVTTGGHASILALVESRAGAGTDRFTVRRAEYDAISLPGQPGHIGFDDFRTQLQVAAEFVRGEETLTTASLVSRSVNGLVVYKLGDDPEELTVQVRRRPFARMLARLRPWNPANPDAGLLSAVERWYVRAHQRYHSCLLQLRGWRRRRSAN